MSKSEASRTAAGFLYVNAAVSALSGLVSVIKGPRLAGLAKLGGAGAHVWAALEPSTERLQVACAVSAGLGVVDVATAVRPGLSGGQRVFRLGGAIFNGLTAVLHSEAAKDL